MSTRGNKVERADVNSSEEYELEYQAKKLGVTPEQIREAKEATGSNDHKKIEEYIKGQK